MYSAYEPTHSYQIPAVVNGAADPTTVVWSVSNPSLASIAADPVSGGVMITMTGSGSVTVTANANGVCGESTLDITPATPDEWDAGRARYNDGVVIAFCGPRGCGDAGRPSPDAGLTNNTAQCTNCHGPTANGPYKTVAHTPEQAGGFSDAELIAIFTDGVVPDGGYFDSSIVSYARWQTFHKWSMSPDEQQGLVVYLRSLTPAPQTGSANFGGHHDGGFSHDGGFGHDGGVRHDGGVGLDGGDGG